MNRFFLHIARSVIPRLPKGKSLAISLARSFFGDTFEGIIRAPDGRKFYIEKITAVDRDLFFLNKFEDFESEVARKIIKPGDYVVDVGASFGWYTTLASQQVGDLGKVFAFELAPNIAEECKRNVQLNHQHNVVIESLALGEDDGSVEYLYSSRAGMGNLRTEALQGEGGLEKHRGAMISLDHYIEKHSISRVDFIKCDVDGAEVPFLKGARATIALHKPVILIEVSDWAQKAHGRQCREIFEELATNQYRFFSLHNPGRLIEIKPAEFGRNFKENVLCVPNEKPDIVEKIASSSKEEIFK